MPWQKPRWIVKIFKTVEAELLYNFFYLELGLLVPVVLVQTLQFGKYTSLMSILKVLCQLKRFNTKIALFNYGSCKQFLSVKLVTIQYRLKLVFIKVNTKTFIFATDIQLLPKSVRKKGYKLFRHYKLLRLLWHYKLHMR